MEGIAEATASLLKLASGRLADQGWSHKSLVVGGYGVSNLARPLIGLALGWGWVLLLRFLDRVGDAQVFPYTLRFSNAPRLVSTKNRRFSDRF
jgi:hypothetical protein